MTKNKDVIIKSIILAFVSFFFSFLFVKTYYSNSSLMFDRVFIIFSILCFIGLHFILDVKKLWDFIYRKRYFLGIILFIFLVANGYHGSSIGIYNGAIQGEVPVENGETIFGENQVIRGDEYAVSTPFTLSQANNINNFSSTNHNLMAQDKSVSLYMRYPSYDITSIAVLYQIGFLFLPVENAFSFYWFFPLFFTFFATFELLMLLTKEKKVWSLIGTMMITFGPAYQWWGYNTIIASGESAILMFNKYLNSVRFNKKILYSILIGIFGSNYIMNLYPAWLIPYGYFFLVLVIWLLYIHRESISWKELVFLIVIVISTICIILVPALIRGQTTYKLITNTVYPGARFEIGGYGFNDIIKYMANIFVPIKGGINNPSEMAQFISFYPVPTILGIYYSFLNFKNKNNDFLLNGLIILSICLSFWNYFEIPAFIAKITLLYMSTVTRANITLGFINIVLLIYCLSCYNKYSLKNYKGIILIALGSFVFVLYCIKKLCEVYPDYFNNKHIIVLSIIGFVIAFILIFINNKYTNKLLITGFLCITFVSGLLFHPLNKGLNVFYEKPITKEVQKIVNADSKAKWISVNTPYFLQNYITVTGVSMVNSTNYFPNYKIWNVIDKDGEFNDIYNRYAHLTVNLTDEKTDVSLLYNDHIKLDLNVNQLKELDVSYILTCSDLSDYESKYVHFEKIYNEYGILIYKIGYNNS